jgi:hypothetical protein
MNITLLTMHSEEYRPLANLTMPGKKEYAGRHGYEFVERRSPALSCWERPAIWLEELIKCPDGGWMFFTGTDVLFTNHTIDARTLCDPAFDLIISADGNGLMCDSFIIRKCLSTTIFLCKVSQRRGTVNNEQDAIDCVLSNSGDYGEYVRKLGCILKQDGEPPSQRILDRCQVELNHSNVRVKIVPQRTLNSYCHSCYGGSDEMPHSWHPGDLLAHFPGKTLAYRLEVMPRYLAQVIRQPC